ncbi:hypothetical protein [Limosilactobacillus mucosae]|uniref:hypothetical protein n=1 Tax=Limosilactobacillus mucosae TaxID=97478 RepID=UPI0022DF6571|nr:hypothetical protein [Limosilactobacillus mucosae]
MEENYDLGLITSLEHGVAKGIILGTQEPFAIRIKTDAADSLMQYMVVAINPDHTDFIYQE